MFPEDLHIHRRSEVRCLTIFSDRWQNTRKHLCDELACPVRYERDAPFQDPLHNERRDLDSRCTFQL